MELVECPECGGYFGVAGEDNVFIHVLGTHEGSSLAAAILRELLTMDPGELVR